MLTHDVQDLSFLNQGHADQRLAYTWFLKIDPVQIVGMLVSMCVHIQGY